MSLHTSQALIQIVLHVFILGFFLILADLRLRLAKLPYELRILPKKLQIT